MDCLLVGVDGATPRLAASAWVAPGAVLAGDVLLEESASVWYGAVLRADDARITVEREANLQDGVVVHSDPGLPVHIGAGVSVGHRAVLHGCRVDRDSLIGIGAVVLNGAHLGQGCLVAAGAVILEGTRVPPRSLVAGVPGKVRRGISEDELADIVANARHYVELAGWHRKPDAD